MSRTSASDVAAIMLPGKDYDLTSDLTPFIRTAGVIVDRLVTRAGSRLPINDAEAERLECLLSAHLYCMSDRTYKSRKSGAASGAFDWSTGLGFDGSTYGQMAKVMDPSGGLAFLEQAQKAPMVVGGFWAGGGITAVPDVAPEKTSAKPDNPTLTVPTIAAGNFDWSGSDGGTINGSNFDPT